MTHPENSDILSTVVQLLTEQGSAGFAEGIRLLVNEAMVRERSAALRAEPYQRSEARLGHSNGFKDKTLSTRVGKITFDVPQVRGGLDFYPSALEKGIRSEQASTEAVTAQLGYPAPGYINDLYTKVPLPSHNEFGVR